MQQLQKDDVGRALKIKNEESIFKIEQNLSIIEYDIQIFKIREATQQPNGRRRSNERTNSQESSKERHSSNSLKRPKHQLLA